MANVCTGRSAVIRYLLQDGHHYINYNVMVTYQQSEYIRYTEEQKAIISVSQSLGRKERGLPEVCWKPYTVKKSGPKFIMGAAH